MRKYFAVVRWMVEDVQSIRPEWTQKKCREWLEEHEEHIQESAIQDGWQYLELFLD